mgnify:CR=1 FL=1
MQVCPVIFGSSYFPVDTGSSLKRAPLKTKRPEAPPEGLGSRTPAQIYDLAHERRLKALHSYIEQGCTLSEAARLIGVSALTVHRWDDHGRR